jgi:hypothetical protein
MVAVNADCHGVVFVVSSCRRHDPKIFDGSAVDTVFGLSGLPRLESYYSLSSVRLIKKVHTTNVHYYSTVRHYYSKNTQNAFFLPRTTHFSFSLFRHHLLSVFETKATKLTMKTKPSPFVITSNSIKMKLSIALCLIGSAAAFQPAIVGGRSFRTSLSVSAEQAIAAAKQASEKYGASSPEAALAWEAVEEIDSSDNSAAYQQNKANMMSDAELAKATSEFQANLNTVQRLTKDLKDNQKHMEDVAKEMQALKLTAPENRPAPKSPELDAAIKKAKQASEEFGNKSKEAQLAWETVEEIASSGLSNAMGKDMTEECLVEAAEACLALEELDRFINYEKITEGGLSNF